MNLELVPYKAEHAIEIIRQQAKQPGLEVDELTKEWARIKENKGPAKTGLWHGKVVGCGGLEICWPGMAEAWFLLVQDVDFRAIIMRTVKKTLWRWIEKYNLVRVQAPLRSDFPQGIRCAEWIGFIYEATLECYHPDRTAALMYKIINKENQ